MGQADQSIKAYASDIRPPGCRGITTSYFSLTHCGLTPVIGDLAKYVKFLMAAIPRHSLLNLGKSRIRARNGRVAAGLQSEALRIAGTLALLVNPTIAGQFLAALPRKAPPASEPVAALMLRLTGVDITRCPVCRVGRLQVGGLLRPGALPVPVWDTS